MIWCVCAEGGVGVLPGLICRVFDVVRLLRDHSYKVWLLICYRKSK